jgi:guanosine-3',5'-bis(diphosphate) 3'-pyrophosphohydrolase
MEINEDTALLLTTIDFAARKHALQKRKGDGSAYINHPIGVAMSLMREGGIKDLSTLQAAVLHDTLEGKVI